MFTAGLEQYKDLIHNYNALVEKNLNLKRENRCLQINYKSFEKFAEERNNRFNIEIQERCEREKTNSEKLQLLKCLLCERENVMIKWSHIFHSVFRQMDDMQDCLGSLINNMCEELKNIKNLSTCKRDIKRSECSQPEELGNRIYPCEKDLMVQQNCCEHNSGDHRQKLMCVLEECYNSKNDCTPIRTLLEQSKIALCCLIREMGTENIKLKGCQDRDIEICNMKSDLVCLTAEMKKILNQKLDLDSGLSILNEELLTKNQMNEKLLMESEKLKDELINMKYCLDMRINEKKAVSKELCENNQRIEDQVKTIQEMESKLCNVEKKLLEAETLRTLCTDKCSELTEQIAKLEKDLKNEKNDNCNKENVIINLRKQIVNLETVIKGLDIQRSLYEEQINNLEKEKSATEFRLNEVTNNFNRICQNLEEELTMAKSELGFMQGCIRQKGEENSCLSEKNKLLECNIGNHEKTILESNCVNESLAKKLMLCQSELTLSKDKIECLEIRVIQLTKAREEQTKQRLQVEENMKVAQIIYEETKTKNDWLISKSSRLEWENCKLTKEIGKLNISLNCAKKKEAEMRNDLSECNVIVVNAAKSI